MNPELAKATLVVLLLESGMRIGVVGQLVRKQINLTDGVIRNHVGKGLRSYVVILTPLACEFLQRHFDVNRIAPNGKVFDVDAKTLWRWVREVGELAGIHNLHPHYLRHTFASEWLDETHDVRLVQQLLGHARISTTLIYTERSEEELRSYVINRVRSKSAHGGI